MNINLKFLSADESQYEIYEDSKLVFSCINGAIDYKQALNDLYPESNFHFENEIPVPQLSLDDAINTIRFNQTDYSKVLDPKGNQPIELTITKFNETSVIENPIDVAKVISDLLVEDNFEPEVDLVSSLIGSVFYIDDMNMNLAKVQGGLGIIKFASVEGVILTDGSEATIPEYHEGDFFYDDEDEDEDEEYYDGTIGMSGNQFEPNILVELEETPGIFVSYTLLKHQQEELRSKFGNSIAKIIK